MRAEKSIHTVKALQFLAWSLESEPFLAVLTGGEQPEGVCRAQRVCCVFRAQAADKPQCSMDTAQTPQLLHTLGLELIF